MPYDHERVLTTLCWYCVADVCAPGALEDTMAKRRRLRVAALAVESSVHLNLEGHLAGILTHRWLLCLGIAPTPAPRIVPSRRNSWLLPGGCCQHRSSTHFLSVSVVL